MKESECGSSRFNRVPGLRVLLFALGMIFLSPVCSGAVENGLHVIDLKETPSSLCLTEDGRHLVCVLRRGKNVVVVDAERLEEVIRLEVPGVGPVFSRSGKLYVSDAVTGLIRVYSEANWELVNEIDSGVKQIETISARRGGKFGGKILVSSQRMVNRVDLETDQYETLQTSAFRARFSPDGDHVIDRSKNGYRAFSAEAYLAGGDPQPLASGSGGEINDPLPLSGEFWWGRGSQLCVGLPPMRSMGTRMTFMVADQDPESRLVFGVTSFPSKMVEVRRLDDSFTLVKTIDLPDGRGTIRGSFEHGQACARRGGDDSVTLFWPGFSINGVSAFKFSFSEPLRAGEIAPQRVAVPQADESVLVSGPEGAVLGEDGVIVWEPDGKVEAGKYQFKVKQTVAGKISFFRKTLEVLPAEKKQIAEERTFMQMSSAQALEIKAHANRDKLALLDGRKLLVFDKVGQLSGTIPLEEDFGTVACLDTGFVLGLKSQIDFIDPDGKSRKSVDLGGVEVIRLEPTPDGKSLLVTCRDATVQDLVKSLPIYRVDLESFEVQRLPQSFGQEVFVHPAGDLLLSFISHSKINWVGIGSYYEENTDLLMGYQMSDGNVRLRDAFLDSLRGIQEVSFSPDGTAIAVTARQVPSRGQMVRGMVAVFSPSNLEKPERLLRVKSGILQSARYHPKLHLLFVLSRENGNSEASHILVYDREGNIREDLVPAEAAIPKNSNFLMVAPGGEHLLVEGEDLYGRKILQRISLKLTDDERKENQKEDEKPLPVFSGGMATVGLDQKPLAGGGMAAADGLPPSRLKALFRDSATQKELAPELMAQFLMPAVAIINAGEGGIGAGFFVSNDGHLLTAAHCLPALGGPEVIHYVNLPNDRLEFRSKSVVIDIDEENDLALIKIDCNANSPALFFAQNAPLIGSKAFAIGHPGIENLSLDYTMTSGLVSSAPREFDGRQLLQISAAVNPGNSGGPVLDSRGNVIGMVTQKAELEGASFAVPAAVIGEFLKRRPAKVEPERPGSGEIEKNIREKGWTMIDQLTFTNGGKRAVLKNNQEQAFTGTLVVLGNPLNHVLVSTEYKDGFPHGTSTQYNRSGNKVKTTAFQNGQKSGPMTTWYPSGNPELEVNQQNGKPNGFSRQYDDRKFGVREAVCFKDGVPHGFYYQMDELGRVVLSVFHNEGQVARQAQFNHFDRVEGDPMIEFAKVGDTEMLRRLIKDGVSINFQDGKKGQTALHAAVLVGFHQVVKEVLAMGADPNLKNNEGQTPLALLMAGQKPDIVLAKILLEKGAKKEGIPADKLELLK